MPSLTMAGFIDRLLAHPRGQIVLTNIIAGFSEGLYTETTIRDVLANWRDEFRRKVWAIYRGRLPAGREEQELVEALDAAKKPFRVLCPRRAHRNCALRGFGSVTHPSPVIAFYISERDRRRLTALGIVTGISKFGPASETEIEKLLSVGRHTAALQPGKTVGNPESVLWIAPLEDIEKDLVKIGAAERVRDSLGLIHRNRDNEPLVLLELPVTGVGAGPHGRPTFVDAGGHRRFKTRADGKSKRSRGAWGHTVDLERLALGACRT